jgi:hypothetical protein
MLAGGEELSSSPILKKIFVMKFENLSVKLTIKKNKNGKVKRRTNVDGYISRTHRTS